MTAADIQNKDRIDSPARANDFATRCSLEAWDHAGTQANIGNEKTISQKTAEQGFLDFGTLMIHYYLLKVQLLQNLKQHKNLNKQQLMPSKKQPIGTSNPFLFILETEHMDLRAR